jgi:hypothetical protein
VKWSGPIHHVPDERQEQEAYSINPVHGRNEREIFEDVKQLREGVGDLARAGVPGHGTHTEPLWQINKYSSRPMISWLLEKLPSSGEYRCFSNTLQNRDLWVGVG